MNARRGFTLIEMLVVLGIILVLAGVLLPVISKAQRQADRNRTRADLGALSQALEAYANDFKGAYPRPTAGAHDAKILTKALLAPDAAGLDGQDGPGFKVVPGGQTYGPYIKPDAFKISGVICDRYGMPIAYLPRYSAKSSLLVNSSSNPSGQYQYDYADAAIPAATIQLMLGDDNLNNSIDNGEKPRFSGTYILASSGPDKKWLDTTAIAPLTPPAAADKTDDIFLNFDR